MADSMQHWNGNIMCAVDTETTGFDVGYHEIIQLAILPLDSNFKPMKKEGVMPLNIFIRPDNPERIDPQAMKVNKIKLDDLHRMGLDSESAIEIIDHWYEKLDMPYAKFGSQRCRIIPLGHNIGYDIGHLKYWLGDELYNKYFHWNVADTLITAQFLNDRAAYRAERVPFSKKDLGYVCSTLKIKRERSHDALQDCIATAECYRRMMRVMVE